MTENNLPENFAPPEMTSAQIDEPRRKILKGLEEKLGVQFKNLELLNVALTHTSFANEMRHDKQEIFDHNEKLEFLGDAVLELASSTFLFNYFKNFSEGELTKTRATIVCQATLAKIAKQFGLGDLLLLSNGEASSGGRNRESTLEDAFESIIGAIYLDSGWEVARDFIFRILVPECERVKAGDVPKDYKGALQEFIQRKPGGVIEYIELSSSGPDHMKIFEHAVKVDGKILGKGKGRSKKIAEQNAAKEALKKLNVKV